MPPRDARARLRDVLIAIDHIEQSMAGLTLDEVVRDREKIDSIVLNFFRIGEAVYPLTDELLARRPEVPWRLIRGLRNLLAHVYWGIDVDLLWETAQTQLGQLRAAVEALLTQLEDDA